MIQKYQKKPVTIEAIQFKEESIPTIKDWLGENLLAEARYSSPIHWIYRIKTLEGNMLITEGDFIIRGVKGEFYPCKPDIFYATYNGPVKVLWDHTTGEYDKEWLLPRAFKKESGEHIPNGYNIYITEKEVEKISEDRSQKK